MFFLVLGILADHHPTFSLFSRFRPYFHQFQRLTFFVVCIDEKGFNHLVYHLLGFPVQRIVLADGEIDIAGSLMAQFERLFFIYFSKHIENALAAREVLRLAIEEDGSRITYSAYFIIIRQLALWLNWLGLSWSLSAEEVKKRGVAS